MPLSNACANAEAVALVLLGALLLIRPRAWQAIALCVIATIEMATQMHQAELFWQLTPAGKATRWLAPVALALLLHRRLGNTSTRSIVEWLLRVAAAATFTAHGIKAFELHGPFQDLIYAAGDRVDIEISPAIAGVALKVIGAIDVLVAIAIGPAIARPASIRLVDAVSADDLDGARAAGTRLGRVLGVESVLWAAALAAMLV